MRLVRVGAALGLVAGSLAVWPATSEAAGSYTATANARLVGIDFTVAPSVAFDQLIDAGVSTAQAQINSLGDGSAFASSPYPSNSVVLLPGLVAGISDGKTSKLVPAYPLIAASNATTPTDHKELGTLVLDAESAAGNGRGSVTDGATRAVAKTFVNNEDVIARAETTISSLQLGPLLSLDGVRTVAEARRSPGGKVKTTSSFEIAAITVMGQRVAVAPKGAVLQTLLAALSKRGTTLRFVPADVTDDGITSAGLIITSTQAVPPQLASGLKEARVRTTVGFASVSVTNRAFSDDLGATDEDFLVDESPAFAPAFDSDVLGDSLLPHRPVTLPRGATPAVTTHPLPVNVSLAGLYPILVLGAVVGVGLVSLIRHLGVRSP